MTELDGFLLYLGLITVLALAYTTVLGVYEATRRAHHHNDRSHT